MHLFHQEAIWYLNHAPVSLHCITCHSFWDLAHKPMESTCAGVSSNPRCPFKLTIQAGPPPPGPKVPSAEAHTIGSAAWDGRVKVGRMGEQRQLCDFQMTMLDPRKAPSTAFWSLPWTPLWVLSLCFLSTQTCACSRFLKGTLFTGASDLLGDGWVNFQVFLAEHMVFFNRCSFYRSWISIVRRH